MLTTVTRLLSFDPGTTTGISFLSGGDFVFGMAATYDLFKNKDFMSSLTRITQPTVVLIERPPDMHNNVNSVQMRIYHHVLSWYQFAGYNVVEINPGQWKKLVERSRVDSVHIRDATDIAVWYYRKEMHNGQR